MSSIVHKIKRYFHNRALVSVVKRAEKIDRKPINIKRAKSIGILFDASNPTKVITVTKFSEKLVNQGIKVDILGYVNNKEKELSESFLFNNNDVNWYGVPVSSKVKQFENTPYDILISAFVEESMPLEYIAASSKSKFRIGAFNNSKIHCFDFMINLGKQVQLNYLLNQIKHFLEVINKQDA